MPPASAAEWIISMRDSNILWEGKSQKCHFFKEDLAGILIAVFSFECLGILIENWNDKISDRVMVIYLLFVLFYELLGKFLFRFYYSRHTEYRIYDDKVSIIVEIMKKKYIREFLIKDISSIKMIKYNSGIGSIHFGDAETKYWDGWNGKYNGMTGTASVTTIGLLRKNDKWHSGILYSIKDVECVYRLLLNLLGNT